MTSKHWTLVGGAVACLKPIALTGIAGGLSLAVAQAEPRDLAFPGYSGYLNVPSATVLNHGQADIMYSDQALNTRQSSAGDTYAYLNNIAGAFGVFPLVEVGGRIAWDRTQSNCYTEGCRIRDLSANIKVQAPLIPENWFTLAVGVQDIGGETDDFESMYVVAGRQFGPVEISAGYGDPKMSGRYLDGAFGGVSYRPVPWLNVMAEYDSQDVRLGLGAASPEGMLPLGMQIKGKVLAYDEGDTENGRHFFSLGLSIPFGNKPSKERLETAESAKAVGRISQSTNSEVPAPVGRIRQSRNPTAPDQENTGEKTARRLGQELVSAGYDRVSVASEGDTLHIQWENNIYVRDERDSVLDVARRAKSAAGAHKNARLTLLNQNIPVAERTVPLQKAHPDGSDEPYAIASGFSDTSLLNREERDWDFQGSYGPTWKPRITLSPTISSGVATEYGVWDASVGISAEVSASLWTGALASATYNTEIYQTEDFERGGVFYGDRQRNALIEAEVQQTFKLHPQVYTSFHGGRYAIDWNGGLNETMILSPDGRHSLSYLGGAFRHRDDNDTKRNQMLGRYSYYNPDLDAQFDIYGGQFFAEDTGVRIDSRFWFGDYAITLSYKNTDAEFISLGWVIPLTPEKTRQFRYAQVRGDADWSYSVQTRINEDQNLTSFGGAAIVRSANPIQSVYLNRGRITNN
ncbi:YjbH domain-containing protein [Marinobacter sp. GN3S48]|uniref:YjbH domain-containing protein n=1 Tax=Marinobacter sp. GN3S48 TaxID=3382302 RepID=UPI00387B9029